MVSKHLTSDEKWHIGTYGVVVSKHLTSDKKWHIGTYTTMEQTAMYMVSQLLTLYQKGHKETFTTWQQVGGVTSFDLRSNMAYKDLYYFEVSK